MCPVQHRSRRVGSPCRVSWGGWGDAELTGLDGRGGWGGCGGESWRGQGAGWVVPEPRHGGPTLGQHRACLCLTWSCCIDNWPHCVTGPLVTWHPEPWSCLPRRCLGPHPGPESRCQPSLCAFCRACHLLAWGQAWFLSHSYVAPSGGHPGRDTGPVLAQNPSWLLLSWAMGDQCHLWGQQPGRPVC